MDTQADLIRRVTENIDSIMVDCKGYPHAESDYDLLQYAEPPVQMRHATIEDMPTIVLAGKWWISDMLDQIEQHREPASLSIFDMSQAANELTGVVN